MKDLFSFCNECWKMLVLCLLSVILLWGCGDSKDNYAYTSLVKSFQVKVGDKYISGTIDETNNQIFLKGVQDGSLITEVNYSVAKNVAIYPKPETRVNDWQKEEKFVLYLPGGERLVYTVILEEYSEEIKPSQPLTLPDAGRLKGVHWKTYTVPTFGTDGTLVKAEIHAKPKNLSDEEKISLFASWGLNCIALKLEDGGQMTEEFSGSEHDDKDIWNQLSQAEREILNKARAEGCARFVKAAHHWNSENPESPVYIMLFTRKWFQRNGNETAGSMQEAADMFADVITICKEGGYDDCLIGVHAVEMRIDAMNSLLPSCLKFADIINATTNDWLKSKTLFFSGLGMGISFRGYAAKKDLTVVGIDECSGSDTFWADIQSRCAGFCWVHKHYPKWDNEPTYTKYANKYGVTDDTYQGALEQLLEQFGHSNLKNFVAKAPSEMYNNVLFWGDASDGIRHLNKNVRDALKTVWLYNGYYSGLFYHFFDINANNNSDVWNTQNNIAYLDENKELKQNIPFLNWERFFDGKYDSTYGSTSFLEMPE